jgi:penicillin-binding protein 1A
MKKIHAGLSNKAILDGDPSAYGLTRVTTCAVSGQLATSACRNDAMDYGTVTDYWAAGTEPTVHCQMHTTARICIDSGMTASAYCYNVEERGVVSIPNGHPLQVFLGTQYADVLAEYLGASSVYGSQGRCTWHTSYQESTTVENTLIPDALMLLAQAQNMLITMDPYSAQFANLQSAVTNLQYVIGQPNPSQSEVATAMAMVSQAMAGY